MGNPDAIPEANAQADEANARIAELVAQVSDAATTLAGFTDGARLNITRIALHGTATQLDAWRDTRVPDAELQVLIARWRELWRAAVQSNRRRLLNLRPRGLDIYAWEAPEECDHPQVRLGADVIQQAGQRTTNLVHVDLVRVAQQPTTLRLLGPTAAETILGLDGILQDGHPLRSGTSHGSPPYRPDAPTWIPDRPEPRTPARHVQTSADTARVLLDQQDRERQMGLTP